MGKKSLRQRMSDDLAKGEGVSRADFEKLRDALTTEQVERIKDKCRWEGVTWLGVLRDWPSLFEPGASDG